MIFLPPYSPFLNPIEFSFSKIKNVVRGREIRDTNELISGISGGISAISEQDLRGWYDNMMTYLRICLRKENINY